MITKEQAFGMYIGQKITDRDNDIPITKLKGIKNVDNILYCQFFEDGEFKSRYLSDCKLILRPFEDITEQEWKPIIKIEKILYDSCVIEFYSNCAKTLRYNYLYFDHEFNREIRNYEYLSINKLGRKSLEYLISIGIDVFNLRERGWAVYESDLKGENNETN